MQTRCRNMIIFFKRLFSRRIVILGAVLLFLFLILALLADVLSPCDPFRIDPLNALAPPSAEHLLGTDEIGRDLLSRLIYGARTSLLIGVVSVMFSAFFGMLLGMLAGYLGGVVDTVISRVTDAFMAIPSVMLAIALGILFGQGMGSLMLILGLSTIPTYTRLMRGQVLAVRNVDYILAERVLGATQGRIMFGHVMPNCLSALIVLTTQNIGSTILAEASLSFLGLGIVPPTPSWGSMVNQGYMHLMTAPVFALAPGLCVVLLVLGFNIFGDGLRDVLDPRLRGTI
ncbi:MAG: ABC transporter permease [Christensenellaceae bacterium]|nr:ABC transporter permease [Christensenellaceae bacterium]